MDIIVGVRNASMHIKKEKLYDSIQDPDDCSRVSFKQTEIDLIRSCRIVYPQFGYDIQNVLCGLHSGFPLCCVFFTIFFTKFFPNYLLRYYSKLQNLLVVKRKIINKIRFNETIFLCPGFGRTVCPICLIFSKKTGWISCDCGKYLSSML